MATSFEISKKLKEIGFKANALGWHEAAHIAGDFDVDLCTPFYDFDEIWKALPDKINNNEILNLRKCEIGYYFFDEEQQVCLIGVDKEINESLADTAARLLILLYEKEIIKNS